MQYTTTTRLASTGDTDVDFLQSSCCPRRCRPHRAMYDIANDIYRNGIAMISHCDNAAVEGGAKDRANDGERIERGVRFVPAHTGHHRPRRRCCCQGHPRLPIRGKRCTICTHIVSYRIIQHHIVPCHIVPQHTIPYTIPYHDISYHTISYHTPYHVISYHSISYCTAHTGHDRACRHCRRQGYPRLPTTGTRLPTTGTLHMLTVYTID